MSLPRHRFAVYRSRPDAAPERVGYVTAAGETDAYEQARAQHGEGPFLLRAAKSRADLPAYINLNGFKRAQDRIGLMVYKAPCTGKRAKHELTIGAEVMCLYDLTNRRRLVQQWELTP